MPKNLDEFLGFIFIFGFLVLFISNFLYSLWCASRIENGNWIDFFNEQRKWDGSKYKYNDLKFYNRSINFAVITILIFIHLFIFLFIFVTF